MPLPGSRSGKAGKVVDLNVNALSEALYEVLEDEERRQVMGDAGRKLVLSSYTWPKVAAKSIAAYQELLT